MTGSNATEISRILREVTRTRDAGATARLFEAAYGELRRRAALLMSREPPGHTLQATALVNEAYLRLVGDAPIKWQDRAHFFGIVAMAMRRVLVEHARRRATEKRGGGWGRITLHEGMVLADRSDLDILDLDRILCRFAEVDPRAARVAELRVFGGLKEREIAEILDVSERTVRGDWQIATMWLNRELRGPARK